MNKEERCGSSSTTQSADKKTVFLRDRAGTRRGGPREKTRKSKNRLKSKVRAFHPKTLQVWGGDGGHSRAVFWAEDVRNKRSTELSRAAIGGRKGTSDSGRKAERPRGRKESAEIRYFNE